jgi:hypothetical protein
MRCVDTVDEEEEEEKRNENEEENTFKKKWEAPASSGGEGQSKQKNCGNHFKCGRGVQRKPSATCMFQWELIHSTYNTMPPAIYATAAALSLLYKHSTSVASSISHHVLDVTPVLVRNMLLHLLLRQPLEIVQPIDILLEIGLASHDPRLHKERSNSLRLKRSAFGVEPWLDDVVANWDVANDPGIHVGTGSLDEHSLCSL